MKMQNGQINCSVTMTSSSQQLEPVGNWSITEDLAKGSVLDAEISLQNAPKIEMGHRLDVCVRELAGNEEEARFQFWIHQVSRIRSATGNSLRIQAMDPLGHASRLVNYQSHVGKVDLAAVARKILGDAALGISPPPRINASGIKVAAVWLLQAGSNGTEFIRRLAASCGAIPFWDRQELRFCARGSAHGQSTEIDDNRLEYLTRWELCQGLPRVQSGVSLIPGQRESRTRLLLEGALVPCRLGDTVPAPGNQTFGIERLEHRLVGTGACETRLQAVPIKEWGHLRTRSQRQILGPFPAEVTHNEDPDGRGWIRVRLLDDPDKRPTPYIPLVLPQATEKAGWHWLPEVGDRVLVAAPSDCPENLVCQGAFRDRNQKIPRAWKKKEKNAVKALMGRNGTGISLDDQEGSLRLVTPKGSIEIDGQGNITIQGNQLTQKAKQEISITSERKIKEDAPRIELG
jgi:hypothetical protein